MEHGITILMFIKTIYIIVTSAAYGITMKWHSVRLGLQTEGGDCGLAAPLIPAHVIVGLSSVENFFPNELSQLRTQDSKLSAF